VFFTTSSFANYENPTIINISINNKDSYPYCLGEGKDILSTNPGVAIEAMQSIEHKLNIKFNFIRDPWSRQKRKLQYNSTDMLFSASYKKSREKMGVYPRKKDGSIDQSRKIISAPYVLYKLKESPLNWDGEKFINLTGKIATQKGYSIVGFLNKKGVDVVENRSDTDIKLLLSKRVEGVARHIDSFDKFFKLNPEIAKKIVKIPTPLVPKSYYLLASNKFYKNNSVLVNKIWNELKNINTSDKFKHIRAKY